MPAPLILRIIGDNTSYLKTVESTISTNTKLGTSFKTVGVDARLSAEAQIASAVKAQRSLEGNLVALQAAQGRTVAGSRDRAAADLLVADAQARLNRQLGITTVGTRGLSGETKTAERDLGKLTRGALAGSGVFAQLGRSLAFASAGFIAVAGGATLIAGSIRAAEKLQAAQRSADRQLQTSGKSWTQYGTQIDSVLLKEGHLAGFTRSDLLQAFTYLLRVGGNVARSLNLTGLAADVARGRHIALSSASIALSKALGGSATALRRLGIIVPSNVTKMQALEYVQQKFAGQAAASTKESDRLNASLSDAGATIGTELLPSFERVATAVSDYLQKANETGRLQHDVNEIVRVGGDVFHTLGAALHYVDDVTGSLGDTTKLLVEIYAGFKLVELVGWVNKLAVGWGLVEANATKAAAAEGAASAASAGAAASAGRGAAAGGGGLTALLTGGLIGKLLGRGVTKGLAGRIGPYTMSGEATTGAVVMTATRVAGLAAAAFIATSALNDFAKNLAGGPESTGGKISDAITGFLTGGISGNAQFSPWHAIFGDIFHGRGPFASQLQATFGRPPAPSIPNSIPDSFLTLPPFLGGPSAQSRLGPVGFPGTPQITDKFTLPFKYQLQQAEDALTASLSDDVKTAKSIITYTKKLIDEGNYHGQALLQLLQTLAGAQATVDQAAAAAQARRDAAKAKALQAASTYNVPGYLQLAEAKAQAYGQNETAILKKIIAAAEHAIAAGGKNWQGLVAAYNAIAAARAQLAQDAQAALIPLRLQLQLARAQALGLNQDSILRRMKAALERALKAAKGNIEKQIAIYNQIASINQQLGSSVTNAYGDYKKASLKWETQGLGLTPEQRRALEARLSQIGPGGTHPMTGTGAAGFVIDPATGRPIHHGAGSRYRNGGGGGGGTPTQVNAKIDLSVYIDGKQVEAVVTRRQQRNNTRRPTQRRGPNAATR